jgi:DNA-binding NtrC family response regulator
MTQSDHTLQIVRDQRVVGLNRRQLRLAVLRGPDRRQCDTFTSDRVVIGTHPRCDFVLGDPKVSRQHCAVELVPEGYAVRDLGSTNGCFLDQVRVREVIIDGDVRLRIGDTVLRITPLDQRIELPLSPAQRFGPLLGRSVAMRRIFEVLERVAPTDTTVLITGESGTGKEVTARAVHEASRRADGPFVVVDCASLPANLIESELFGYERGAFTGALRARVGAFETASGGTLFLDELGEMPLDLQSRLLGVLERRQVQPVGASRARPVDVRVVAATNRDLRREINRGAFREDLYFRLAVVSVEMPPLRSRPEDIPLYVEAFLSEWAEAGVHLDIEPATIDALARQPWPGNVRELRNTLERAAALGELPEPAATGPDAPPGAALSAAVDASVPFKVGKTELLERYERAYLGDLMARHQGNITRAARAAEIDRVYLLRLLDKYGLRPQGRR